MHTVNLLGHLIGFGWRSALMAEAALGSQRLSILIFHRVLAGPEPIYADGLQAADFERLVARIAGAFTVLRLGDALTHLQQGSLPTRALVITFDDGYADNADLALPILQRHGVAATFFIATGFLDGGCMWNDKIIHMLRHTRLDAVDLAGIGLGRLALGTVAQREQAIGQVLKHVKYRPLSQREDLLARLALATQVASRPEGLMMRSEQVQQMQAAGMEIGGHTVHHPILTELDATEAAAEIRQGRHRLQSLTDAPVDVFAYPNGKPGQDYASVHVDLVRQAGFRGAVSTAQGTSAPGDDLFQLPRFSPWDADLDRWLARLVAGRRRRHFDVVAGP